MIAALRHADCHLQRHATALWLVVSVGLFVSAASGSAFAGVAAAQEVAVRFTNDGAKIEIVGLFPQTLTAMRDADLSAEQWAQLFTVTVAGEGAMAPMIGKYAVEDERIVFAPRFPLRTGLEYLATFDPAAISRLPLPAIAKVEATFALPNPPAQSAAKVTAIYPCGEELPANLLRFYIHFSAPMSRGDSYHRIHIVGADGREVPHAFLELREELWDSNCTRLTVLFDPGRIKRGLKPNEDVGAPLIEGRDYALVIDAGWPDAQGNLFNREFRKPFRVTELDDVQPKATNWRIVPPPAGTREPLLVEFDEPLDRVLVEHMLHVRNPAGRELTGSIAVSGPETKWQFKPEQPWQFGAHELVVDAGLEDRAGNSVGRPFETRGRTDEASDDPVLLRVEIPPR